MEPDHAKWITQPATADYWTIRVEPDPEAEGASEEWMLTVTVHCNRRPRPLYVYVERNLPSDQESYSLADAVHHVQLVLEADRPPKKEALVNGLMGAQKLPY